MKRNRLVAWPIILLLVLAGCSPFYILKSQSNYEKGIKAYQQYLEETDTTAKKVYKEKAIEHLKESLKESKSVMETDPTSDKGYLFFLKASIILSGLDYKNSQSYVKDAFTVSQAFRLKTIGQKNEALGAYYFVKCVVGLESVDAGILSTALVAIEYALKNLPSGPEKAESESIKQILEFLLENQ